MRHLLWISLLILAMAAGWYFYLLSRRLIKPRLSVARFCIFLLLNLLMVFLVSFVFGMVMFRFRNYLFK